MCREVSGERVEDVVLAGLKKCMQARNLLGILCDSAQF